MDETPSEAQLFYIYEAVFEALLHGLVIGVAVMVVAALVLIALCCWGPKSHTRRRDAALAAAQEAKGTSQRADDLLRLELCSSTEDRQVRGGRDGEEGRLSRAWRSSVYH